MHITDQLIIVDHAMPGATSAARLSALHHVMPTLRTGESLHEALVRHRQLW